MERLSAAQMQTRIIGLKKAKKIIQGILIDRLVAV
jgi:hypothetical protein